MDAKTFDIDEVQNIFKNVEQKPGSKKPDPIILAKKSRQKIWRINCC